MTKGGVLMEIMMDDQIKLTAYNQDTETSRLDRLNRVLGYVYALLEVCNGPDSIMSVHSLHDHKGLLTVSWLCPPDALEKSIFEKAWGSCIGDGGGEVEHLVKGS